MFKRFRKWLKKPPKFTDTFEIGEVLGSGGFSTVCLVTRRKDGERFASKVVPRKSLAPDDEALLRSEVKVLQSLDHPYIVRCLGYYEEKETIYMPLELCEGGDLLTRIVSWEEYTEATARDVMKVLLEAIEYCHQRGIMHRDLKPDNLLLASRHSDTDIKVADFGFAEVTDGTRRKRISCGTLSYVAPEVLCNQPYGIDCDMWSIGVICYILLTGDMPFPVEDGKLRRAIKAGRYYSLDGKHWAAVSDHAKDLVRRMLVVDPAQRITAQQALRHVWFSDDQDALAHKPLGQAHERLAHFNARRKLRSAIASVLLAKRLGRLIGGRTINDHYELGQRRGTDPRSTVYTGTRRCATEGAPSEVAIKVLKSAREQRREGLAVAQDVENLLSLAHSNITSVLDWFEDDNATYMVSELVPGGELFDYLAARANYNEFHAWKLIRSLLRATAHCHSQGIAHRDMRPGDLLTARWQRTVFVKIAGFGYGDFMGPDALLDKQLDAPAYVAPEVLSQAPFSKEVDVWSLGIMCFILFVGYPPFQGDDVDQLWEGIMGGALNFDPHHWNNVSAEGQDLVRCMLTVDPLQRITAKEALHKHPYMTMDSATLRTHALDDVLPRMQAFNTQRRQPPPPRSPAGNFRSPISGRSPNRRSPVTGQSPNYRSPVNGSRRSSRENSDAIFRSPVSGARLSRPGSPAVEAPHA